MIYISKEPTATIDYVDKFIELEKDNREEVLNWINNIIEFNLYNRTINNNYWLQLVYYEVEFKDDLEIINSINKLKELIYEKEVHNRKLLKAIGHTVEFENNFKEYAFSDNIKLYNSEMRTFLSEVNNGKKIII